MNWEKIKMSSWGVVGGALVTMYVGFNVAGWMTDGSAKALAKETAATAVAERLGTICVAQFNRDNAKGRVGGQRRPRPSAGLGTDGRGSVGGTAPPARPGSGPMAGAGGVAPRSGAAIRLTSVSGAGPRSCAAAPMGTTAGRGVPPPPRRSPVGRCGPAPRRGEPPRLFPSGRGWQLSQRIGGVRGQRWHRPGQVLEEDVLVVRPVERHVPGRGTRRGSRRGVEVRSASTSARPAACSGDM